MAYIDTSALLKWYIPEIGSERVDRYLSTADSVEISRLTCLEIECAIKRRTRAGSLSEREAGQVVGQFQSDLYDGLFTLYQMTERIFLHAQELLRRIRAPLRSLDALHLATAAQHGGVLVTADQVLARAAAEASVDAITL